MCVCIYIYMYVCVYIYICITMHTHISGLPSTLVVPGWPLHDIAITYQYCMAYGIQNGRRPGVFYCVTVAQ